MMWFLFDGNNICGTPLNDWLPLPELAKNYSPAPVLWICHYNSPGVLIIYDLDMLGLSTSTNGGAFWINCSGWDKV